MRWKTKGRIPVTLYARVFPPARKGQAASARTSRAQHAPLLGASRSWPCSRIANFHSCVAAPHLYTFIHGLTRRPGRSLVAGDHDMQSVFDIVFADEEVVHACCTILLEWRTLLQQCHLLRLDTLRLVRSLQNQRQLRSKLRVLHCLPLDSIGSC